MKTSLPNLNTDKLYVWGIVEKCYIANQCICAVVYCAVIRKRSSTMMSGGISAILLAMVLVEKSWTEGA